MEDNRTTGEQQVPAQDTENQEAVQPGLSNDSQPDDGIPEKFLNKSPMDIIRSYNDLEKHASKLASERSEERKAREVSDRKLQELEIRMNSMVTQPARADERTSPEADPFAEFDKEWEENPKEAAKSLVGKTKAQLKREYEVREIEAETSRASEYYQAQTKENPEYVKLVPKMQALAAEYGDLVRDDRSNSVKALKLLHLAALGATREEYASERASQAKKETSTIKDEKRQTFSESTSAKGETKKRPEDLTIEEWEKLYPVVRR